LGPLPSLSLGAVARETAGSSIAAVASGGGVFRGDSVVSEQAAAKIIVQHSNAAVSFDFFIILPFFLLYKTAVELMSVKQCYTVTVKRTRRTHAYDDSTLRVHNTAWGWGEKREHGMTQPKHMTDFVHHNTASV
jgi:hypothetical protein